MVDAGNLKHEWLNRLWSISAVNVLRHDTAKGRVVFWEIGNRLQDNIKVDLRDEIMKM